MNESRYLYFYDTYTVDSYRPPDRSPKQDTDSFGHGVGILCSLERLQTIWGYSVSILNLFEAGYSQFHGVRVLSPLRQDIVSFMA